MVTKWSLACTDMSMDREMLGNGLKPKDRVAAFSYPLTTQLHTPHERSGSNREAGLG